MKIGLLKCGKSILTFVLAFSVLTASLFTGAFAVSADTGAYISDSDLADNGAEDVDAFGAVPSLYQYEYNKQGIAAFLHFSMSTMTEKEVADGNELPSQFTLDQKIDADGYVKAMKDAGFGKIIITTKHHDGFCIWDSAWTEHDIASTNYPGDVLEDLSIACTKYDMDMGIYMSPWDQNSKYYGNYDAAGNPCDWTQDALNYNDYFVGQLTEILGNDKYGNDGRFVEVWLDPAVYAGYEYQWYDYERWVNTIRQLEGKAAGAEDDPLIFGVGSYDTGVHWIGNESGIANDETWSKLNHDDSGYSDGGTTSYKGANVFIGEKYGNLWTVMEADVSITPGWFWGTNKTTPKDLEYLREMYCHSVGHGATLLLNVPLNNQGKLDDAIRTRVEEWSENIQKSFIDNNLAAAEGVTIYASDVQSNDIRFKPSNVVDGDDSTYWTATQGTKNSSLLIDFGKEVTFDAVTIEEEIYHGQRVEAFSVKYKAPNGAWIEYASGTTIGSQRVILDVPVRATQVKIEFQGLTDDGEVATPVISHVGVHKATKDFQIVDGWVENADGTWSYYKDGAWATGWLNLGAWYYLDANGVMRTGWVKDKGIWYYMNTNGAMQTGWQKIGGTWYYMDGNGAMQTGWQQVGGTWYYFASSGAMQTGWVNDKGTWYYMNTSGAMRTGWQQVGGTWYYFASSGAMLTGWQQIGGTWYYFASSGAMHTGWLNLGGTWYYMYSSGAMATNIYISGGYINASGVWR